MVAHARLVRVCYVLSLCLVLVLAGCNSNSNQSGFFTISRLHAPNLQWLSALSRIPLKDGRHGGIIFDLAAFQQAGSSTPEVIMNVAGDTSATELYELGLDGSHQRRLDMKTPCGSFAVTADGQWLICSQDSHSFQIGQISGSGVADLHQVTIAAASDFFFTWSPDGRYFATASLRGGVDCSISVFAAQPPYHTFTKVATLTSTLFAHASVDGLNWTADGRYLLAAISTQGSSTSTGATETPSEAFTAIPTDFLSNATNHPGAQPITVDIPLKQFSITAGSYSSFYLSQVIAWNPINDTVVFPMVVNVASGDTNLVSFDLHTHTTKTLLALDHVHQVQGITWTPDGQHLLLVVGFFCREDCFQRGLSDVYLLTTN